MLFRENNKTNFKGAVHSKTQLWPLLVGNINL